MGYSYCRERGTLSPFVWFAHPYGTPRTGNLVSIDRGAQKRPLQKHFLIGQHKYSTSENNHRGDGIDGGDGGSLSGVLARGVGILDTGLAVGRGGWRGCVVEAVEGWKQAVIGHPGGDANLEPSCLPPGGGCPEAVGGLSIPPMIIL